MGAATTPTAVSTPEELDTLALALVESLRSAALAAGCPVRKGARSAAWWNKDCALAAAEHRAVRRIHPLEFNQEIQNARNDFPRVVRRAKRLYWRNLIDSVSDSAAVFKDVRWLKAPGAF